MNDVVAWVGLGSNLDDPATQLNTAIAELDQLPQSRLFACSGLYRSAPMGPQDQPDYFNAVAGVETGLSAEALLEGLQTIEQMHARIRARHWGPRTLDLDILLYGDDVINSPHLTVPHPGIARRNFVLVPLSEIEPQLIVPGLGAVQVLRDTIGDEGLKRVADAKWHSTAPDPDLTG